MVEPQPQDSFDEIRRIALWAVPRSVSTAFERIFVERDDAEVLHEPFSHAYYHGPERHSDRFADTEPAPEHAYGAVQDRVVATDGPPIVFLKDMAYHAAPMDDATFYAAFANTFLIRQPREALASLHRIWPDFSPEEAGCRDQARLFDLVTQKLEQPGIVVDATDFRREPEHMMRSYCAMPSASDTSRRRCRGKAARSRSGARGPSGTKQQRRRAPRSTRPPQRVADDRLPAHLEAVIERCQPYYERLYAHRLGQ